MIEPDFFHRPSPEVARDLIGARLGFAGCGGIIVETEAYLRDDAASHSFNGPTARNAAMFGPSAHAYVYRSYGIHWCLNFVCLPGSAVLIRALEPTEGLTEMAVRRRQTAPRLFCSGPGRLTQALGITIADNTKPLLEPPFALTPASIAQNILTGPRIGISKAVQEPLRFGQAGSIFLSRNF